MIPISSIGERIDLVLGPVPWIVTDLAISVTLIVVLDEYSRCYEDVPLSVEIRS